MSDDALATAAAALAGTPAWVVGGAVRDELAGRPVVDLDLVVPGDAHAAATRVRAVVRGPLFALSDAFGGWRAVAPDRRWHVDVIPLRGETLDDDLALRDFTVNAIARPLGGGELVDPHGGAADLAAGVLRMVSGSAFADDPLRVVRLARFAAQYGLVAEPATLAAARAQSANVAGVAQERVFAELCSMLAHDAAVRGLTALDEAGALVVVLPEVTAMRGVEQNPFHHLDVLDHTLATLQETIDLEREAERAADDDAAALARWLAQPLADELDRATALRFGALLHDAGKPATRAVTADGRITFLGHDRVGAELARDALARLRASDRLRSYVAAIAEHHLRLGFLVHEAPLSRRAVYRYLTACDPVAVDVTLVSVADRVATRGRNADAAIAKHLELARQMIGEALAWENGGRPEPLVRGDELAESLGIEPGPELGRLLAAIAEARFAGEATTRDDAIALARTLI